MFTFVLADAQLELAPPGMLGAPSIRKRAMERRRPAEHLLLDQAQDHKHMRLLPERERRGRPDIVHFLLLLLQDSPLPRKDVKVLIHTRDDALIRVRSDLRPPRAQATAYTLFEDLLRQGKVPIEAPLLTLETGKPLARILAEETKGPIVLLDESGTTARTADFAKLAREHEDITLVIGAFPHGDWREKPKADHTLRVAGASISAWSALVPVLAGFEDAKLG